MPFHQRSPTGNQTQNSFFKWKSRWIEYFFHLLNAIQMTIISLSMHPWAEIHPASLFKSSSCMSKSRQCHELASLIKHNDGASIFFDKKARHLSSVTRY
jgi:hypothetical protein